MTITPWKLPLSFILYFLFITASFCQNEQEFSIGLKYFENLQYDEALKKFEKLSREDNPKRDLASLFYSKSLLRLNRLKEAESSLQNFNKTYPDSKYSDEARLTLAKTLCSRNNYKNAFYELISLAEITNNEFYKDYSRSIAEKICNAHLSEDDLKALLNSGDLRKQKPFIKLLLGKMLLRERRYDEARINFVEILQEYPLAAEKEEANNLYHSIADNQISRDEEVPSSVLGVMLPLSNNNGAAAAKEILEGIKYAVADFNIGRKEKTGIIIKDTELNPSNIDKIKEELSAVPGLKAIIGPIYSKEVREALEAFKDEGIVIISPTATDDDLTEQYENFFQANPNFTVRGKVMAQYIYYVENKRNIAVLNAIEGYSPMLATSFAEEFERIGGRIVIKETYKSGSYDLDVPVSKVSEVMADIEGIYIPLADKVDAPVILSQLEQKGIDLPLYGDQDWLYSKGFESSPVLSNQLTFTSDHYIDYNNQDYIEFNDLFFRRTKSEAGRNVLYGFDTAKYLLTVLRNFSGSANAVKLKMQTGLTTNGFHNNITFDEDRVNKSLNIIRCIDGKFELVDEFKLN